MSPQQAGEKTEKATPRKRRQAREDAQVLKSAEVITAFSLLVLFGVLSLFGSHIIDQLQLIMTEFFTVPAPATARLSQTVARTFFQRAVLRIGLAVAPVLAAAVLAGLVANYLQVGFLFASKGIQPKMSRINPLQGWQRIFSRQSLAQLVKALIKIICLLIIAYHEYKERLAEFPNLMWFNIADASAFEGKLLLGVAFKICLLFAILGPVDYFYEWRKREKELMMTKQELRDEFKLTEGDPQVKGRIRQRQRQISGQRMIQAVPQADVVITNPTRFAVALAYDAQKDQAPHVLAKGRDYLAKKIRETAQQANVEIVEDRQLAQALYFFCEIGDEVPEELYQAVAEILAYVYRLKNRQEGAAN